MHAPHVPRVRAHHTRQDIRAEQLALARAAGPAGARNALRLAGLYQRQPRHTS